MANAQRKKSVFLLVLLTGFLFIFSIARLHAEPEPEPDPDAEPEIRYVIETQLEAFARGDAATAYAQAAPSIQAIFPSEQIFMIMVYSGYYALIGPKRVDFLELYWDNEGAVYRVGIESTNGKRWVALYRMSKQQEDATWKISGCQLFPAIGESV